MQLDKNIKYNITFDTNVFDRLSKNSNFFNSFNENFSEKYGGNFNYIITPAMFLEYVGVNLKNINQKDIFKDKILNTRELNAYRKELYDLYRNKKIETEIRYGTRQLKETREWKKYQTIALDAMICIQRMAWKVYSEMEELQIDKLKYMFEKKERECQSGFKPSFDSVFKRFWHDKDYLFKYICEFLRMDFLCRYNYEIITREIIPAGDDNKDFAELYINKLTSTKILGHLFEIYRDREKNVSFTRLFTQMAKELNREGHGNNDNFQRELSLADARYFRSAEGIKARSDLLDLDLVHFSYLGVFRETGEIIPNIAILGEENNKIKERMSTHKRIKDFNLSVKHYNQFPPSGLGLSENFMSLDNYGFFLFFDLDTGEITHEIDVKNVISESDL